MEGVYAVCVFVVVAWNAPRLTIPLVSIFRDTVVLCVVMGEEVCLRRRRAAVEFDMKCYIYEAGRADAARGPLRRAVAEAEAGGTGTGQDDGE